MRSYYYFILIIDHHHNHHNHHHHHHSGDIFSAGSPHGTWRLNLKEPYGQMVAAECLYLANYKAGCTIQRLLYNNNQVTLERSYILKAEDGEEGALKKFKLDEFYKHSRIAANQLIAGKSLSKIYAP